MSLRMREARAHRRVLVPERLRRHLDPWPDDIPSVEDHPGPIQDLLIRHITADRLHGTVSRAAMERYLGA